MKKKTFANRSTIKDSKDNYSNSSLSQSIRMDLNKKSKPEQMTITASKGTP